MNCMKCGRETEQNQVFCSACLANAEKAPVKTGTKVVIPQRPKRVYSAPVKQEKPEELILKLHRQIRNLKYAVFALMLALSFTVGALIFHYSTTDHSEGPAIGSNYSTEAREDRGNLR